jgi:hypothetical protein
MPYSKIQSNSCEKPKNKKQSRRKAENTVVNTPAKRRNVFDYKVKKYYFCRRNSAGI